MEYVTAAGVKAVFNLLASISDRDPVPTSPGRDCGDVDKVVRQQSITAYSQPRSSKSVESSSWVTGKFGGWSTRGVQLQVHALRRSSVVNGVSSVHGCRPAASSIWRGVGDGIRACINSYASCLARNTKVTSMEPHSRSTSLAAQNNAQTL